MLSRPHPRAFLPLPSLFADPSPSPLSLLSLSLSCARAGARVLSFGFIGAAAALVFSSMGAAYGTAKSGVGIAAMGVMRPELVMKSIVPVVMAGVLGIYGFIISVLIAQKVAPQVGKGPLPRPRHSLVHTKRTRRKTDQTFFFPSSSLASDVQDYKMFDGYAHLASGLACGLSGLSAGMAIGVVGDSGVRANAQQPKLFVGMILILIFAEALALYGLIVGIILSGKSSTQ